MTERRSGWTRGVQIRRIGTRDVQTDRPVGGDRSVAGRIERLVCGRLVGLAARGSGHVGSLAAALAQ